MDQGYHFHVKQSYEKTFWSHRFVPVLNNDLPSVEWLELVMVKFRSIEFTILQYI